MFDCEAANVVWLAKGHSEIRYAITGIGFSCAQSYMISCRAIQAPILQLAPPVCLHRPRTASQDVLARHIADQRVYFSVPSSIEIIFQLQDLLVGP